jgi:hypothetical protein
MMALPGIIRKPQEAALSNVFELLSFEAPRADPDGFKLDYPGLNARDSPTLKPAA